MQLDLKWLSDQFPNLTIKDQLPASGQKWSFRCAHPQHADTVLKLVKPGKEGYLDRELEAVRRLQGLHSNNVPPIYEVNLLSSPMGPIVWLLEQYVHGYSLASLLAGGPLPGPTVLRLAGDLLTAASEAELVGVVHRDIKPDNIIIDSNDRAWLLDFGIARILDLESKTKTDAISGPHTPGYGAPEQFKYNKRSIDGRSDLFAIGVVLYECASGINPFRFGARDRLEILSRTEHDPLPRLNLVWDTRGLFADFISQLTQKYPHQRPASCVEARDWFVEIAAELQASV